jgi:sterol desaturase/sphingolipid hydroxylase (fatty acid hydroxylase superfamily)
MMNEDCMTDRHAGLSRAFDLSAWAYFLDFILVPVAAIALLFAAKVYFATAALQLVIAAVAGALVWTLAEYWIHRLVFHGNTPFEPMHDMHHRMPKDMIGLASWATFAGFAVIWAIAALAGVGFGAAFTAGFMLGYLFYCAIHVRFHHGDAASFGRYAAFMHAHHVGHHRGGKGNFGVTSPVWDLVFGSFRPSK